MIHHINFRVLAHATEDTFRVREALDFFLSGSGVRDSVELIEELCVEGHHGNPITIYSALLKKKAACLAFAHFIKAGMSEKDALLFREEMPERLDDDLVFHLRFDKQAAYLGEVKLTESSDAVTAKVKIATYPKNREKAGLLLEELFG